MQLSLRQLFLRHVAQTSPSPMALEIERAEGVYLYDAGGRSWMDMISGISVSNVGHRHPAVIGAIHEQLDKHMHLMVYGEYVQSPQVLLASKLAGIIPPLDSVYFVNSGAEAVEGAIKLSRRVTGRKKIFSFKNAYHGSTTGALSLMSNDYFTEPFRPLLPEVYHLEPDDFSALHQIDESTAAVFVEIVRGEAGALPADESFLHALRARCTETGSMLVADEIQTGFGRCGHFFACQGAGIVPDILVIAKGMGGGMPIGAFMSTHKHMSALSDHPVLGHITTFGGHPVCCASALATLEILQGMDLPSVISSRENTARTILVHPLIKTITGKGLLLAIGFENERIAQEVIGKCIEKGVITDWFLFAPDKLRLCPPLTITETEMERACQIIREAIHEVYTENENMGQ